MTCIPWVFFIVCCFREISVCCLPGLLTRVRILGCGLHPNILNVSPSLRPRRPFVVLVVSRACNHTCPLVSTPWHHSFTHSLPCPPSLILFLRSFLLSYLCYPYLAIFKSQAELRFATAHLGVGLFANWLQVGEFIRLANMAPKKTTMRRGAVESSASSAEKSSPKRASFTSQVQKWV